MVSFPFIASLPVWFAVLCLKYQAICVALAMSLVSQCLCVISDLRSKAQALPLKSGISAGGMFPAE